MSNTLPKKIRKIPAKTNVFTFEFQLNDMGEDRYERGEMKQTFSGQPLLMTSDDQLTALGYRVLTACMADNIKQLAAMSASVGLNPLDLINEVGRRLRLLQTEKPVESESKIELPKLII